MNLPSSYIYIEGETPKELEKHNGKPKLSYSAIGSFKNETYRGEFIGTYFLKLPRTSTIFTTYGSATGTAIEDMEKKDYLSDFDFETLINNEGTRENAIYEQELIIEREGYIIQGFADKIIFNGKKATVIDFKTGSIASKASEYASEEYNQTVMYAYALEQMGYEIEDCYVILFDRKGNTLEQGNKNVLRLTGEVLKIPTPYSKERAEKFLASVDKTAKEIESYYNIYQKYFS